MVQVWIRREEFVERSTGLIRTLRAWHFDQVPQLYIDPVECIDCGACVPVCPVSAIFALDDLPEKWKHFTELNASYVQGGKFTPEEYAKHSAAK